VKESKDEDHDPAGGENWNDGGHAGEEGLNNLADPGVFHGSSWAEGICCGVRVIVHSLARE